MQKIGKFRKKFFYLFDIVGERNYNNFVKNFTRFRAAEKGAKQ